MNIEAKDVRPGDYVKAVYDKGDGVTVTYEGPVGEVAYGMVYLANGYPINPRTPVVTFTRPDPVLPTEIGAIITDVKTYTNTTWDRGVCIHPGVFTLFDLDNPTGGAPYMSDEIVSWE